MKLEYRYHWLRRNTAAAALSDPWIYSLHSTATWLVQRNTKKKTLKANTSGLWGWKAANKVCRGMQWQCSAWILSSNDFSQETFLWLKKRYLEGFQPKFGGWSHLHCVILILISLPLMWTQIIQSCYNKQRRFCFRQYQFTVTVKNGVCTLKSKELKQLLSFRV